MTDEIDRVQPQVEPQTRPANTAPEEWINLRGAIAAVVAVVLLARFTHATVVQSCLLVGFFAVPTQRWIAAFVTVALLTLTGLPIVQSCLAVGFVAVLKIYWQQRGYPWERRLWPRERL